jgi:fumarylpyruvate hydrolase
MGWVIAEWPRVAIAVAGQNDQFPVRRVFCVGRNYAEHAREMGHDEREPPFFFGKAPEALTSAARVVYPPMTRDLHHEVELVVALSEEAFDITADQARRCIWGYAVGVDLTRRDLQAEAKRLARPWYLSKSWIGAAPIGPLLPASSLGHPRSGAIWLEVDGRRRQQGDLADMIWSVDEIIAHLSRYDRLLPGDVIFTGTPAGVGPLQPGNRVVAGIEGLPRLEFTLIASGS